MLNENVAEDSSDRIFYLPAEMVAYLGTSETTIYLPMISLLITNIDLFAYSLTVTSIPSAMKCSPTRLIFKVNKFQLRT